jgi:porin
MDNVQSNPAPANSEHHDLEPVSFFDNGLVCRVGVIGGAVWVRTLLLAGFAVLFLQTMPCHLLAGQPTNDSSHSVVLVDPLGSTVTVPTNRVAPGLLPRAGAGLKSQVPTSLPGGTGGSEQLQREDESREGNYLLSFFPSYPPHLMPYLAGQDQLGNTAFKPGPLFPATALDVAVQQAKYRASEIGLRYSLQQTFTWVSMSDVMQGERTLGYYTLSLQAKWAVYDAPGEGNAGWLSTKIAAKSGLGTAGETESAGGNLGSISDPTGIWSSVNGFRIPELAWQQSLRHGELVLVAGMVNQGDYFDGNRYANNGRGQFLNMALINSMVVPLPSYNFGFNVQWQPVDEYYGMLGSSVGYGSAGHAPWTDFAWDNWSVVSEFGYAPRNVLGLGPGVYRIQPFLLQPAGGELKWGLGLNFQQQLGTNSRFGWFGRAGRGGSPRFMGEFTQPDTGAQVGTGFVMRGPLDSIRLLSNRGYDACGLGFVWSHPSSAETPVYHSNEYGLELSYVLQFTPTMKLQPDFQLVWNAAHNPDPGPAATFQLQLNMAW